MEETAGGGGLHVLSHLCHLQPQRSQILHQQNCPSRRCCKILNRLFPMIIMASACVKGTVQGE